MTKQKTRLFDRIEQAPNLTGGLVAALVSQIESGQLSPGQRLPTEQAIVTATGVSRTVVREALASLRARGLITTRQGLGAFVADASTPRTFSINAGESSAAILQVLELRLGIETEAASLAALRRTEDDVTRLHQAVEAVSGSVMAGQSGADEDLVFHRIILTATRNAYFTRVFDVIGSAVIPRQRTRMIEMSPAERSRYMQRMHREHTEIVAAIEAADPQAARRAMSRHLSKAYVRLQLASALGSET